jgi:hypothetical protein
MTASPYPIIEQAALYDTAQVEEYINMLFRNVDWQPGQVMSVLGIGEKGTDREGVFKERQIIAPAFLGGVHAHLKRWAGWNTAGFMVPAVLKPSAVDRGDVKLDQLAALTAIILDLDSGDITAKAKYVIDRLGKPSMIVASGGLTEEGKLKAHLYWLLNEPSDEIERLAALRKLLAAKSGGDPSFGRATQVVRVPGTVHAKNGKATLCRILERSDAEYSLDDLADIIEGMQPMPGLPAPASPGLSLVGGMDFSPGGPMNFAPRQDTAVAALRRDVHEGGEDLNRWGEFSKVAGFKISEARAGRMTLEAAYGDTLGWTLAHMVPPWPEARIESEFRGLLNVDVKAHGQFPAPRVPLAEMEVTAMQPTPATWPFAATIPPRPWLFGRWMQRGIVTAVIAPGGLGKSSLMTAISLSMTSGVPFLGKDIYGGPLNVWSLNLEDDGNNLARGRIAAATFHKISPAMVGDRLFVDSGPDGARLCVAVEDRNGFTILMPVFEAIVAALKANKIDCFIVDPLVSSHALNENDNTKIDAMVKEWARVAKAANCAIVLVHHSKKMNGEEVTADSARGASALNNAARITLVLNRMSPDQADLWGIDATSAKRYFSVGDDKHNLSAAEAADWFKIEGQSLGNASDIYQADDVGVVTRWSPPRAMDGVDVAALIEVQRVVRAGEYTQDAKGKKWVGTVIASTLGIDIIETNGKRRVTAILQKWLESGALKVEVKRNEDRKPQKFIVLGSPAGDLDAYRTAANAAARTDEEDEDDDPVPF